MKNSKEKQQCQKPILRFSPTAWAKLVFLRDMSENEVGGFGITKPDDLLFVTDIALVKQSVTSVSVLFDDVFVADYFESQVEIGRKPEQFVRIWLHTHPGNSPEPSGTDENTFNRVFGKCDWSVMFILAQDGSSYAKLHFAAGPQGDVRLPVYVDYEHDFGSSNFKSWRKQYRDNVTEDKSKTNRQAEEIEVFGCDDSEEFGLFTGDDLLTEIELMDPLEREYLMGELSIRSEFWNEDERGVFYE